MPLPSATYLWGSESHLSRVGCVLWYLFFPFVLVYHSVRIYVVPCFASYALGACGKTWLAVGEKLCCWCNCRCSRQAHPPCCCFQFEDGDFPPDATSIGAWKEKNASEVDAEIEWKRGNEICKLGDGEHMRLFSGKIEPADIGQGQLGDCWLMTSLACLSEFPGAIQNIFEDLEYSSRGRYTLRLYCGQKMQWETIEVDDRIPVKSGTTTPIFAKPHGEELWVALLEKAFAKFVGSYAKLDGGFAIWGLQAMTGDKVANWMLEDGVWKAYEIRYRQKKGDKGLKEGEMPDKVPVAACCGGKPPVDPKRADKNDVAFYAHREAGEDGGRPTHQTLSNDAFFEQLREWDEAECVIAASTSGKDEGESTAQMGLVQGHAYSVIEVITVEDGFTYKMLRVSPQPTTLLSLPRSLLHSCVGAAGRCATPGARSNGPATGATTRPSGTRTRRSRRPAKPRARRRTTASSGWSGRTSRSTSRTSTSATARAASPTCASTSTRTPAASGR